MSDTSYCTGCGYHAANLPERIVRWKNIYSGEDVGGYTSRELCDDGAFSSRTCVHRIECDEDGSNPEIFVEEV